MSYTRNVYLAQGKQALAVRNGQSFMFWDDLAASPGQESWDLVPEGGSRTPFPAPVVAVDPGPYTGVMQVRLVTRARGGGKANAISSGSGYASGGRPAQAQAQGPWRLWQSPSQNPAPGLPPSQPRFSNKGMPGFDGHELPLPDLAGELPDVYGVLRGYRWWSLAAPDLSKSPAHADEDWPRSLLRGMRDVWQDGENLARCLTGPQKYHEDAEIPHSDCSCGFWAYWTLQVHDIGAGQLPVCGVVEGYGATVIGERGFRAAKARIVGLHLPFTIQPAGDPDPDPLGLGLPARRDAARNQAAATRSALYPAGQQPSGAPNPWTSHPKFTGRVIGYDPQPEPPPELDRTSAAGRQANRDRAEAWLAVIGDRLSVMYPSAKVFETRAAMEAEFPPDLSYVPDGSREQCPHCSQWYQRRQNHPATCESRRS